MTGPGSATPDVTLASDQDLPDKWESPLCSTTPDTSHEDTIVPAAGPCDGGGEGEEATHPMQDLAQPLGHPWLHILSPLVLDNMSTLTEPQKAEAEGEETKVWCDGCGSMGSQENVVITACALQADSLGLKSMLCG